jgi:hypothetical protein
VEVEKMSEGEYPSEAELKAITEYERPDYDFKALLESIKSMWKFSDCGYWQQKGRVFKISTGGWSGNESIIEALQENFVFWSLCWYSSRRGGAFQFRCPIIKKSTPIPKEQPHAKQ